MVDKNNTSGWEKDALQQVLQASINEQKRSRRWGILFKALFLIYLVVVAIMIFNSGDTKKSTKHLAPHSALIDIKGIIMPDKPASADNIVTALRRAYESPNTKGIILRINSPGGSPVQSSYVYNEIKRLQKIHPDIKVYAVCSDICASGAYYIASATNDIYANPSSMVGSIGVIYNGFGFVDTIKKLGMERRLVTAGSHKAFMDPFSPINKFDTKHTQVMVDTIHQQFMLDVAKGRGNRLKQTPEVFSGLAWTGKNARQLGLIDGFASSGDVARNIIKQEDIINYTVKPSFLEKISNRLATSFADSMASYLGLSGPSVK